MALRLEDICHRRQLALPLWVGQGRPLREVGRQLRDQPSPGGHSGACGFLGWAPRGPGGRTPGSCPGPDTLVPCPLGAPTPRPPRADSFSRAGPERGVELCSARRREGAGISGARLGLPGQAPASRPPHRGSVGLPDGGPLTVQAPEAWRGLTRLMRMWLLVDPCPGHRLVVSTPVAEVSPPPQRGARVPGECGSTRGANGWSVGQTGGQKLEGWTEVERHTEGPRKSAREGVGLGFQAPRDSQTQTQKKRERRDRQGENAEGKRPRGGGGGRRGLRGGRRSSQRVPPTRVNRTRRKDPKTERQVPCGMGTSSGPCTPPPPLACLPPGPGSHPGSASQFSPPREEWGRGRWSHRSLTWRPLARKGRPKGLVLHGPNPAGRGASLTPTPA